MVQSYWNIIKISHGTMNREYKMYTSNKGWTGSFGINYHYDDNTSLMVKLTE